jgi:hypothetical protein
MTRQLRRGRGKHGLILANGGVMTYQHVLLLSTTRRRGGSPYPPTETLPEVITDVPVPKIEASIQGEQDAVVEVSCCPFSCLESRGVRTSFQSLSRPGFPGCTFKRNQS